MKINTPEKYMLLRRIIAARQLEAYAGIKETMEAFNCLYLEDLEGIEHRDNWNIHFKNDLESFPTSPDKPKLKPLTPEQIKTKSTINKLLTKFAPLASQGDLSFFTSSEFEQLSNELPKTQDDNAMPSVIRKLFQDYSKYSQTLSAFRTAEAQLLTCASKDANGHTHIDSQAIKMYHNFMKKTPGVLKDFDTHVASHTPTMLGFLAYHRYNNAITKINNLDGTSKKSSKFDKVTPETFDATITGFYKPKTHTHNIQKLEDTYAEKNTFLHRNADRVYSSVYTSLHKASTRRTMALVAAGLSLAMSGLAAYEANQFSDYGIEKAQENGTLKISDETVALLNSIEQELNNLRNSDTFPTSEQLTNIRNQLDGSMDTILGELVTQAYIARYPNREVRSVETSFDENREPGKQNRIEIEYIDEDKNIQTVVVTNFDTKDFFITMFKGIRQEYPQTISGSFDAEKYFDNGGFSADLANTTNPTSTFTDRAEASIAILDQLSDILNLQKGIAGKEIQYSDVLGFFPSLSIVLPEVEEPVNESTSTNPTTSILEDGTVTNKDGDERD